MYLFLFLHSVIPVTMDSKHSTHKFSLKYGTLSFALLCALFVSHGLLVLGHDPWLSEDVAGTVDDDDFIDFTDMVNYDPVTKKMMNKKEKVQVQVRFTEDLYWRFSKLWVVTYM